MTSRKPFLSDHHYAAHTSPLQAIELANDAGVGALALHHLAPGTTPREVWGRDGHQFRGRFTVPDDLDVISLRGRGDAHRAAGAHRT